MNRVPGGGVSITDEKALVAKIRDQEMRLEKARKFYAENQRHIARQTAIIDEIAHLCLSGGEERREDLQHPAIDAVVEVIHEGHRAASLAMKFRQWCRLVLKAAQRPEFSHLMNDTTWEMILGGIEADLDAEVREDREAGIPI